jgi:hypothetical protein
MRNRKTKRGDKEQLKGNGHPEADVDGTNVESYDVSVGL